MGRESRNFYRRVFYVSITIPILKLIWNRRDWLQSLEYTPEDEAIEAAQTTTTANLKSFSPFFEKPSSPAIDLQKVTSDFSAQTASKEHFAQQIRSKQIERVQDAEVDVLVIGGGATGLFAALDATTRGLRVALVEQSDFGSGVTGASTTLLHSGFKRAQAALRQRDHRQIVQLVQDAGELRALERCAAGIQDQAETSSTIIKRMPTYLPMSSITELFEFCICSLIFCTCTVLGGGLVPVARPILGSTIKKNYEDIQPSETDEMLCGFTIPERKIDGFALSRSLAHTATKHGACVLNYARVIGLDCEERPPRDPKAKFNGIPNSELERRSIDVDGQPMPWFDTGKQVDFFTENLVAKPEHDYEKDEGEGAGYVSNAVSGASQRFMPERLIEQAEDHARIGKIREEDLPFFQVHAAVVRDELSGKIFRIYPKYVLNCTGRWGDSIRRMFPVAQPQMFDRWSSQFFVVGHHNDSSASSFSSDSSSSTRPALVSPRNHIDAKPLFVFPYEMNSSSTNNNNQQQQQKGQGRWSLIGPVDSPIDANDPYFAYPEKDVITGDPSKHSPSLWRELRNPRISPSDLSFIATAADIFGVHLDSGFAMVQPRVLTESWPGRHPSLCRALRFGGAVDYRTMHQKIVHSVGTETVWSRKKAELMVDSYFIESARGAQNKVKIPPCRTKKLALAEPTNCIVGVNMKTVSVENGDTSNKKVFSLSNLTETQIRSWARFDGCATILDALLRRYASHKTGEIFTSPIALEFLKHHQASKNKKQRKEKFQHEIEIEEIGKILAQEWNWSKDRLKNEVDCAVSFFERNSFAADD